MIDKCKGCEQATEVTMAYAFVFTAKQEVLHTLMLDRRLHPGTALSEGKRQTVSKETTSIEVVLAYMRTAITDSFPLTVLKSLW
jgi:hypothetical protein